MELVEDNKQNSADQIFKSISNKVDKMKEDMDEEFNRWFTNAIEDTINSMPKQIAESRFSKPDEKWIQIRLGKYRNTGYFEDDYMHSYSSTFGFDRFDKKENWSKIVEHLNSLGFEAKLKPGSGQSIGRKYHIQIKDYNIGNNDVTLDTKADQVFRAVPEELTKLEKHKESLVSNRHERNKRIAENAISKLPDTIAKSRLEYPKKRWIFVSLNYDLFTEYYIEDSIYLREFATKDDMLEIAKYFNDAGFQTKQGDLGWYIYIRDPNVKFLGIF